MGTDHGSSRAIDPTFAASFAKAWVEAWNQRDLVAVLSHYADEVTFHSPRIAVVMGTSAASVRGKAELERYWRKALPLSPDLHFEIERLYVGSDALTISYRNHRGQHVAESFIFDDEAKVTRSMAAYDGPL